MPKYQVTFERIGRTASVPPMSVVASNQIDLGAAICDYAEKYLRSRDYEVGVNDDLSGGHIIAGMHEVCTFTITPAE